ncbi:DUF6884 domain-containing protein [Haloferax massiliensis]|uniref:DUF6884 domain-containing protein n=1 Tax=Haloferax massiliensis TaxID=1476858 RepID=A0A0D6JSQ8_9EURY|nr:DUF6884 domain-containing protein [Haloferax massiliensis]CQR50907.1 hypothetical protein BN996_02392 [Haloferax massiliensis]
MTEVGLVSCTKSKRDEPAVPRLLYDESPYFRKAREYCERHHDDWLVLSAKHHVLDPDGPPISPYEQTLTTANVETRREWAREVTADLEERGLLDEDVTLVIHAGKAYYEELLPLLDPHPVEIHIPTAGLMFGETLAWYNEQT